MKQTQKQGRKLLGVLLTLALVFGLLPGMTLTALAGEVPVSYMDWDGLNKPLAEKTCTKYTVVKSSNEPVVWSEGWYVVDSDVTISSTVTVSGDVYLILCDAATLTVNGASSMAIHAVSGTLTVYAQSGGTGALNAYSTGNDAIGAQVLTINGGKITASGNKTTDDQPKSGIAAHKLTINGGTVTVSDTTSTFGLYGGEGAVIINGGTVNVKGQLNGIYAQNCSLEINGGAVTATGVTNDAINALNVTINGGKVIAQKTGEADKSGICATRDITINKGAIVESTGFNHGLYAGNGAVTIDGGTVTAIGANAGICAHEGHGVIIKADSTVTASGEQRAIAYASNGYKDTPVKNAIPGTGWTNTEGTEGQTSIDISTVGRSLDSYKKVQFVPHTHTIGEETITFQPWTDENSLPGAAGNYYRPRT